MGDGRVVGEKKTKLMLYSTLVEVEVEVGVELGNKSDVQQKESKYNPLAWQKTWKK